MSRLGILCAAVLLCATAHAASTEFTYQGQLWDSGAAVTGTYDFQFIVYNASSGGAQVGTTVAKAGVSVSSGLFTVLLDFGTSIFDGSDRFLEVGVRPGGGTGAYTIMGQRQKLTPTVYALYALAAPPTGAAGGDLNGTFPNPAIKNTAGNNLVTAINDAATTGTINDGKLATISTAGKVADTALSGNVTIQGNTINVANGLVKLDGSTRLPAVDGSQLTNLNATNLASGTVPNVRLNIGNASNQLVALDGTAKLPAVDGSQLTNLNATNLMSGTVSNARINTGTAANQLVALDGSARLPAVDGSQLTNLPASAANVDIGYLRTIARNVLNVAISGGANAHDKWESYSTATGQANSVDTGNTTSTFSNGFYCNKMNGTGDFTETTTTSDPFVLMKTISSVNATVQYVTNEIEGTMSNYSRCKMRFNYSDLTNAESAEQVTTGWNYEAKTYVNPLPAKVVASIGVYLRVVSTGTAYERNDMVYYTANSINDIVHSISLSGTPTTVYFCPLDDSFFETKVGSVTFEITDGGTNTTGAMNVNTRYSLSIGAWTPSKLIIHQAANTPSRIGRWVALFQY